MSYEHCLNVYVKRDSPALFAIKCRQHPLDGCMHEDFVELCLIPAGEAETTGT